MSSDLVEANFQAEWPNGSLLLFVTCLLFVHFCRFYRKRFLVPFLKISTATPHFLFRATSHFSVRRVGTASFVFSKYFYAVIPNLGFVIFSELYNKTIVGTASFIIVVFTTPMQWSPNLALRSAVNWTRRLQSELQSDSDVIPCGWLGAKHQLAN